MKSRRIWLILILLLSACMLSAQTATHTFSLWFSASPDSSPSSPGTTQIYWAAGQCPTSGLGSLTWNLATNQGAPSYTQANPYVINLPGTGTYCAYVTFTAQGGGTPSAPTAPAGGTTVTFPPGALSVTVR